MSSACNYWEQIILVVDSRTAQELGGAKPVSGSGLRVKLCDHALAQLGWRVVVVIITEAGHSQKRKHIDLDSPESAVNVLLFLCDVHQARVIIALDENLSRQRV
jgi:hypothetical protein